MLKEKQRNSGTMHEAESEEQELIKEFAKSDSKQPVPQPKDFEEIEY